MLSNRFGGIGQAYLDYNEALLLQGHTVQAICHQNGGWKEHTEEQMKHSAKLSMVTVRQKGGLRVLPSLMKIRYHVKRFNPDIIVIHNYVRAGLLATKGLAPKVTITHMYKSQHFDEFAGVIALTNELEEMCLKDGISSDKLCVIPNMVSGPFYSPRRRPAGKTITIGGMGRLDPEKGFKNLIDAASLLKSNGMDFRLKIGGAGFIEEELREQVRALDLTPFVEFCGFITDKKSFFETLDLFVIPSLEEPFGIIALESMKYGVPTITTTVGGLKSIFRSRKTALFVPPARPVELAGAIEELIQDSDLAFELAQNASNDLRQKYSIDEISKQLDAALHRWK